MINLVEYIRDHGLVGTDIEMVNGNKVRILTIDYNPAMALPILGFDTVSYTIHTWNRYGRHVLFPNNNLVPPEQKVWIVNGDRDIGPMAFLDKKRAVDEYERQFQEGYHVVMHEVTLSKYTQYTPGTNHIDLLGSE